MKAATINNKQKNKTLSAQAKYQSKKRAPVRTVLASSLPRTSFKGYAVSKEDSVQFEEKLSQIFQYQPPKPLNWAFLKSYSKEERRELKKIGKKDPPSRAYVVLGFNQVTRAVETRTATVVILTDDMNPTFLIKHFQQCCDIYKIPLLKISNLREILIKCFGFSSMAMALKEIPKGDALYEFYKFLEYCIPSEWERTKTKPSIQDDLREVSDEEEASQVLAKTKQTAMEIETKEITANDVYLYRNNKETRCFVVPAPTKEKEITFEADFVAFNAEQEDENIPFRGRSRFKRNLKIKINRLQGNSNRNKK